MGTGKSISWIISSDGTDIFGQRTYVYFDPKVAYTHRFAWEETQRLWQEGIDCNDESLATAAAGTMLYACYALHGG